MAGEAVIVVDMLKGFLEEGHPLYCGDKAREIIPRVTDLLSVSSGREIIYLCDNHSADDPEFEMFPPHCVKGTEEAEVIEELRQFPGEVVPKTRYSGFFNSRLDQVLENIKPEKVIVVGVCTDICVKYTVADLRNRDYKVVVPADCVASFDQEEHRRALTHMEKVLGVEIT
jgi:nicotinamidase/pyrazinamidase